MSQPHRFPLVFLLVFALLSAFIANFVLVSRVTHAARNQQVRQNLMIASAKVKKAPLPASVLKASYTNQIIPGVISTSY